MKFAQIFVTLRFYQCHYRQYLAKNALQNSYKIALTNKNHFCFYFVSYNPTIPIYKAVFWEVMKYNWGKSLLPPFD